MDKKICRNGHKLKVIEYISENDFEKVYKMLLTDKDGTELFMAMGIKQCEFNFEYMWKDYNRTIYEYQAQIRTYEEIINKLQERIEQKIKDECKS